MRQAEYTAYRGVVSEMAYWYLLLLPSTDGPEEESSGGSNLSLFLCFSLQRVLESSFLPTFPLQTIPQSFLLFQIFPIKPCPSLLPFPHSSSNHALSLLPIPAFHFMFCLVVLILPPTLCFSFISFFLNILR